MNFSEQDKENLYKGIYNGKISPRNLPVGLYREIQKYLSKGVEIGMGNPDKDSVLLRALTENVSYFAAAKTFKQTKDMSDVVRAQKDEQSLRVPFSEFKKEADKIFEQYNVNWLKTEYNTTVGQSEMAQQWSDIQRDKELRPILTYRTTEDERVCEICGQLDLFTAEVDDPIWDTIMPLNHYGCECIVTQEEEGTELSDKDSIDTEKISSDFRFNPGKTDEVFPPDHPYFDVPKEYEALKENNFNLPVNESV